VRRHQGVCVNVLYGFQQCDNLVVLTEEAVGIVLNRRPDLRRRVDRLQNSDQRFKVELDEIMKSVDIIMKKVETVMPAKEEETQPKNE